MDNFIDAEQMTRQLTIAVVGFFIIYFVIAPTLGLLFHRWVRDRVATVFIACLMALLLEVLFIGLFLIVRFRLHVPGSIINDTALFVLSFIVSLIVVLLFSRYLAWWIGERQGPSQLEMEFLNMADDELMPFDVRRRNEMKRRRHRRGE